MAFYLFEVSDGDSKIKGKGAYEYETKKEAVAAFHSKLGIAMKSELYISELLIVADAEGGIYNIESYNANAEEVTE